MGQYTIYHCHSNRSLLDSCTGYKEYADRVSELGYKALALTEHGNAYNWVEKKDVYQFKRIEIHTRS